MPSPLAYRLSGALAVVALVAGTVTFWVGGVLSGPLVSQGSARGTALVVTVVAVPVLVVAMVRADRGSARALVVWLGTLAYLLYNALMFVFATPFNRLFLVYVAMLSLALWSIVAILVQVDVAGFGARVSPRLPAHGLAVYLWVVVVLNALVWLKTIVPALGAVDPASFLADAGLSTNPVFVQDLAVWFPVATLAGLWLWRRQPWGELLAGAVLTLWLIEAVGVATDQWFGHRADPTTTYASTGAVVLFAVLAVVGVIPLTIHLRHLDPAAQPPGGAAAPA